MTEPIDPALASLVAELDARIPKFGAEVRFDFGRIAANRAGYLRLGAEFLRAGLSPMPEGSESKLQIDFGELIHPQSSEDTIELHLAEDLTQLPEDAQSGPFAGCACLLFVLGMFVLTAIGVVTVFGWVQQQL
jgi:hypothetical protein